MANNLAPFPEWIPFVPHKYEPYPWMKPGIFLGGLVPLVFMAYRAANGWLSADPIAQIENELGLIALVFLIASLCCTPAKKLLDWTWAPRIRRELGLFAFFYALLHFLTYVFLDMALDLRTIVEDVIERPFITVGFLALLLMVPLALTSTTESIKKLGYLRWMRLHQLVYVAGVLAVLHFIWRVKIDLSQPLAYALILATLLLIRAGFWLTGRNRAKNKARKRET